MTSLNQDFCFCFSVYQDTDLALRLIQQIRFFYPNVPVFCLSDGKVDKDFMRNCELNQVLLQVNTHRLKLQVYGAAWVIRLLESILKNTTAPNVILLDPDSFILRIFNYLPDAMVGGNILEQNNQRYIQGGCKFFRRLAVDTILNSGLLNNIKYSYDRCFSYQRFKGNYLAHGESSCEEWLIAEDHILSDCIWQLNLKVAEWEEVYCRFRETCLEPEKYAVIHPVKDLKWQQSSTTSNLAKA